MIFLIRLMNYLQSRSFTFLTKYMLSRGLTVIVEFSTNSDKIITGNLTYEG